MIVYCVNIETEITPSRLDKLKQLIPQSHIYRISHLYRHQDRLRSLLGLLLVSQAWQTNFEEQLDFEDIKISNFNRPYIEGSTVDFNISHSGHFVVAALVPDHRVGVDIEQIRAVDLGNFKQTMNATQWSEIHQSKNPHKTFFKFWTIKESIIKADGRGLAIPLDEIVFHNNRSFYDGIQWYLRPFQLDVSHIGCLAIDHPIEKLELTEVNWKEFL